MPSNIEEIRKDLEQFERDLNRADRRIDNSKQQVLTYMMLLQKLGLPLQVERAISILVRFGMTAEQATRALYMLMAASGPGGWAMGLATGAVSLMMMASVAADVQNELKGAP